MRKNKLFNYLIFFSIFGVFITSCDDNMPVVKEIGVESITLSEWLRDGVLMEKGSSINIAWNVTLLPENATDRAENYYSSNVEVATVNAKGQITANTAGTSEITIAVGGKSIEFTLTVIDKIIIPATEIELAITNLELMIGADYDLFSQIKVLPLEANDGFDFSSSNPLIVSVNEEGILIGVSEGNAVITIASKQNSAINTTLSVSVIDFYGDYPRDTWTMTASHPLNISSGDPEKNSLYSAFDGDFSTNLSLVRPGKNYGVNPNVAVPLGDAIYFIVDMKKSQEVNYFRIRHRDTSQAFIRWYAFDQILGSDDGENFELIASNITITNAETASQQVSPDITIPTSKYRYLKFYGKEATCFYQSSYTSQGSTVQIQELYIGR